MKKKGLSEKQIENQVLSWLKFKNIFAFKVKSMGTFDPTSKKFRSPSPWFRKGCPDILCCYKGKMIGLEIKTAIGRLSMNQKIFHQDLQMAEGKVFIIRDVNELDSIFSPLDGQM